MTVQFAVLGPMVVSGPDGVIDVGSPKQRGVLAMLLMNANTPLSAEQIIDGLWGDTPPASAMATLQAYVSNLRRAIEPDRPARAPGEILQKNGGGYQLTLGDGDSDSLRFEQLVTQAGESILENPSAARILLNEAIGLWRGPAYADFRYEDFAQAEATRLENMRAAAIEQRLSAELALGASGDLVPELERLVQEYPLREKLWGHLMLALYRSGRQAEALRAYRRCEEILAEELGILPSENLRNLEMSILNQDRALNPPEALFADVEPHTAIVGRVAERDRVHRALEEARSGRGSMILFEGEGGIGKTRLFETLSADARSHGFHTAFARCVEIGGTPPFWPWIQLIRQIGVQRIAAAAPEYASYLAPLLPNDSGVSSPGAPLFTVAEGLAAALRAITVEEPVMLLIDDLYSADPDSLSLLTLLGAEISQLPIVIVGSHRGQRLDSQHPLADALTQLMRFKWVERYSMRRLDGQEVGELVRGLVGADVDNETIDAINRRTEGNAFFTIELTRLLESEECLSSERATTAVPGTILEVMSRRINRFSDEALRLVRVGAVYGREFDLSIAAEALGLDIEQAMVAVEEAVRCDLVAETASPGVYRFSHMIAVNGVTQALGAIRRAHIHEQIADVLDRRFGDQPTHLVDIAHHRREAIPAGGARPAIQALARAGNYAISSTALELAESLLLQRHDLVIGEPASELRDQLEAEALFDLARIWTWREGYHSERLASAVDRLWILTGIDGDRAEFDRSKPITADDTILSTIQARFSYEIVSGNITEATKVTDTFLSLSESNPDPMVDFAANMCAVVVNVHAPDVGKAIAASQKSEMALETLDPRREGQIGLPLNQQSGRLTHHVFSGWAYWLAGDGDRARTELNEARRLGDMLDHPFNRAFAVCVEGLVGAMDGSPEWVAECVAWGKAGKELKEFGLVDVWVRLLECWSEGMLGDNPTKACSDFEELLEYTIKGGAKVVHTLYMGMLAELQFKANNPTAALEAAERGIEGCAAGERFWYPELERLAAQAHGILGHSDERQAALERSKWAARDLGLVPILRRLSPAASQG